MGTREDVLSIVKKILIGPNPLPEFRQNNGDEILFCDSPLKTYVSGILFPAKAVFGEGIQDEDEEETELYEDEEDVPDETVDPNNMMLGDKNIAEPALEEETSKINNYKPSAMGITFCVPSDMEYIDVKVSAASYFEQMSQIPLEKKDDDGNRITEMSKTPKKCYFRQPFNSTVRFPKSELPTKEKKYESRGLKTANGSAVGLALHITFRLSDIENGYTIYTATLINTKQYEEKFNATDCWYQCSFSVECNKELVPLPSNFCSDIEDEDYQLNSLLYKDVKTYAIGHGCAATWDEVAIPREVAASVMPEYEVKPIGPTESKAKLSMKLYCADGKRDETIKDVCILCDEYEQWIKKEEAKIGNLKEKAYIKTAETQINLCKECLERMKAGVYLLETDDNVYSAFKLANKAMLLQQLHYKLPLIEYEGYDVDNLVFKLKSHERKMPDLNDEKTWYNSSLTVYGKWRPFQLAFLLLNLRSIAEKDSPERKIVDLIWFPTGGGKTEAYLGLSAFTILLRRIKKPNDSGTVVIMRYTLRLLTAQQYERAASLICALEKIRSEDEKLLGKKRITIGLWVGDSLTNNRTEDVIKKIREIRLKRSNENVSVMLKCPWCGASMETFANNNVNETPGYYASGNNHIIFKCGNESECDFSDEQYPLPLSLFDDDIYNNPPTLLFGTVDKFSMLPYRPEAKSLFGGDGQRTPPELIIQDELHLITGPLGSAVGLYETLINKLCSNGEQGPKIIASTATISHAKQQCNALYGCGEENVRQFPVQGITYKDCFFAREKTEEPGRCYVGLYGSAASSSATASIYTFAAFLYAAKAVNVSGEGDRDPYWTNLAYFGSMRELGQAATWYIADIKEHLEVIYRNRLESSLDKGKRRYIYESGLAELTSRMTSNDIPKILKRLEVKYGVPDSHPLDVCLATNMISVGVDIPRLGLMTVTGQPKSMSEYIQTTSRVGRDSHAPGLVFVIYNTSKSRDKSHYEKFQSQHSKLYYSVEPTSVTPFSRPLRERALHAVFVALHRFFVAKPDRDNARRVPTKKEFDDIVETIVSRAQGIDPSETDDIKQQLYEKWKEWEAWKPNKYQVFFPGDEAPLLCPYGMIKPESWDDRGWETPTSMRNVDRECGLTCNRNLIIHREENDD